MLRQANNAVKRNTEFQFFQWLLSQLGISEGESGLDVVEGAKVPVIHKCLCILLEFDVVDVSILSDISHVSCQCHSYSLPTISQQEGHN